MRLTSSLHNMALGAFEAMLDRIELLFARRRQKHRRVTERRPYQAGGVDWKSIGGTATSKVVVQPEGS